MRGIDEGATATAADTSPRAHALGPHRLPEVDGDEVVAGYGVMGVPFDSGHSLALRVWPTVSFAAPYTAVWHRSPAGRWTLWSDHDPATSCARFFGAGVDEVVTTAISVTWPTPSELHVEVPGTVRWRVSLGTTPASRLMTGMSGLLPDAAWRSDRVLDVMGRMAGPVLGAGRLRLRGLVPNGQWFQMAPRRVWVVTSSTATVHGQELGAPAALREQAHLGDTWLPQRGVFATGAVRIETLDPDRHLPATRR